MKKIIYLSIILSSSLTAISQNTWDGSSVSTFTTTGTVGIGVSPLSSAALRVHNTNKVYGIHNTTNLTTNGHQYGIYNTFSSTGLVGNKYGIYSVVSGASLAKYGVYAVVNSNGTYGGGTNASATSFGLYAGATGAGARAAYFNGDVENYNSNTIYSSSNGSKALILGAMFGTNPESAYKMIFTLNKTNHQYDWDWTINLELDRNGSMVKKINSAEKAFAIHRFDLGYEVFRVYGDGRMFATEVNVKLATNFPDYVFSPTYKLLPLSDLNSYIRLNRRLPKMPAAATIEEKGLDVGETTRLLVEKVEELTLYIIQQQELIEKQEARLKELEEKIGEN